jgi:hypothetical protein
MLKIINKLKNNNFKEGFIVGLFLSLIFLIGFYFGAIYVFSQGQSRYTVIRTENEGFRFKKGNTNLLTILGNGNVGIGTTSPQEKLTVFGKIRSEQGLCIQGKCINEWYLPPQEHILETDPNMDCSQGCFAEAIIDTQYNFCALAGWEIKIYDNFANWYHDTGKCELRRQNDGTWRFQAIYNSGGERTPGGYVKCKAMCL